MLAEAKAQPLPAPPPKAAEEGDQVAAKKGSNDAEQAEGDGDGEKGGSEGKKASGKSDAIVTPRPMCVHMSNEGKPHFAHGDVPRLLRAIHHDHRRVRAQQQQQQQLLSLLQGPSGLPPPPPLLLLSLSLPLIVP